ncbi:MAG: hypothetical protein JWO79_133 [Actinomycetia bacterium]|nr:hypothetical protein [Actinomycetes bacterium]MDQ1655512.1 hypothetical protein [Cryptosporangiaceae bacterium]
MTARHRAPDPDAPDTARSTPARVGVTAWQGAGIAVLAIGVAVFATFRGGGSARGGPPDPTASGPPAGALPAAAVVDPAHNLLVGYLPMADALPGKAAAQLEVSAILDRYCPHRQPLATDFSQADDWQTVHAGIEPHPGRLVDLTLQWTGTTYRWQGQYDQLHTCW